MIFSFQLSGSTGVTVLLERATVPPPGDLEYPFLEHASGPLRPHRNTSFAALLGQMASAGKSRRIIAIRNPDLVLDETLGARLHAALRRLEGLPRPFSIAAAGGLTPSGERSSTLYSATMPFLPVEPLPQPLTDPLPDMWIADASYIADLAGEIGTLPEAGLETVIALRGWLDGRLALTLPELKGGINGPFLAPEAGDIASGLLQGLGADFAGETLDTLSGPITLARTGDAPAGWGKKALAAAMEAEIETASDPLSLSIVTRTRFDRPHLLSRLLASISRARRDDMDLEVVISSDVDTELAEAEVDALRQRFVTLDLRLANGSGDAPSRVANLLAGFSAARKEYVAVVDDDDYLDLFAFDAAARTLFLGARPVIVPGSEVHAERWTCARNGRYVLSSSEPRPGWAACGWRRIFGGSNTLPVCGLIVPRERLLRRLESFSFRHDLSEDYALLLLVLTDPHLPPIVEVPATFAHISLREGEDNSVTVADRRGWVRDIALYLDDLVSHDAVAGPGLWRILTTAAEARHALDAQALDATRNALARRERQIRLLEHQLVRLRAVAARQEIPA